MNEKVGFPCPQCESRMDVKDSRQTNYHHRPSIRRRRRCRECGWSVTTYEILDNSLMKADARLGPVMVDIRRAHEAMAALIDSFDGATDAMDKSNGDAFGTTI